MKDHALEAAYRIHARREAVAATRIALGGLTLFILLYSLVRLVWLGDAFADRVPDLVVCLVTGTLYTVSFIDVRSRFFDFVTPPATLAVLAAIIYVIKSAPPEKQPLMTGAIYVYLMVNSAAPYTLRAKIISGLVVVATYCAFMGMSGTLSQVQTEVLAMHMPAAMVASLGAAYVLERSRRSQFLLSRKLEAEQTRSSALLRNVFPESVAARLNDAPLGTRIVDDVREAGVLFADIVGFTAWSTGRPAAEVVEMLDQLFSRFDAVTAQLRAEKIKTIGDAYMVVTGVTNPDAQPLDTIVELALEIRAATLRYRLLTGFPLEIRIGIHAGPVTAGIIGTSRFLYDLWGETVNVASRLESTSPPGQIQLSAAVAARLGSRYAVKPRGVVELKGYGPMTTFLLVGTHVT